MKRPTSISAKIKNFTFTLSNIEVYERMSDDTTAFASEVSINGKSVGAAYNDGQGGPCYAIIDTEEGRDLYRAVKGIVERTHYHCDATKNFPACDWDYSMDFLIGMMVEAWYYDGNGEYVM